MAASKEKPLTKLIKLIITKHKPLYGLLVIVGLVGPLLLPLAERRIKADEKALLVGGAWPTFRWAGDTCVSETPHTHTLTHTHTRTHVHTHTHQHVTPPSRQSDTLGQGLQLAAAAHALQHEATHSPTSMAELVEAYMGGMGLEAYSSEVPPPQQTNASSPCINLHAILRSPLGDGKESILIVTPVALTHGERAIAA